MTSVWMINTIVIITRSLCGLDAVTKAILEIWISVT